MTRAMGIAAGAALILLFATMMIVVMPSLQTQSSLQPEPGLMPYSEQAQRGRDIYVSLGCVYCHSQQPRDPGQAPDNVRGWGRPSVPGDYSYDNPHLLGTMRTGPDLLNIGARQPSVAWHLTHLYNPRAVVPGSTMPSYPFLFEETAEVLSGQVEVNVPETYRKSLHVVARPDAMDLVQYLLELDRTYPTERIPQATASSDNGEDAQ